MVFFLKNENLELLKIIFKKILKVLPKCLISFEGVYYRFFGPQILATFSLGFRILR